MKLIMFSTDNNILKEGTEVRDRMIEYGTLVDEMHIVVFTARNFQFSSINSQSIFNFQISKNIWVYPTNSLFKLHRIFSAYKIGKKIIKNCKLEIRNCVVTTQDPFETGLVGYLIKRKFHIPLQLQIHTDFLSPYFWKESLKNKIRVLIAKYLVKKADGIRVVSKRIKNSLLSLYPKPHTLNPIVVLSIFIDIKKIKSFPIKVDLRQKYPGRFIILMASRFTREKNIKLAIEATKNLIPNHPNILLLIVGSGPEESKLKDKSCKLKANIVFEPWTDDLFSYYKTADLFLLISNYEGYSRTLIEATAAYCPIISTDVGIVSEIKNAVVIKVGDEKALVDAIIEKINNQKIIPEIPFVMNYQDYLSAIKKSWQNCFL